MTEEIAIDFKKWVDEHGEFLDKLHEKSHTDEEYFDWYISRPTVTVVDSFIQQKAIKEIKGEGFEMRVNVPSIIIADLIAHV